MTNESFNDLGTPRSVGFSLKFSRGFLVNRVLFWSKANGKGKYLGIISLDCNIYNRVALTG